MGGNTKTVCLECIQCLKIFMKWWGDMKEKEKGGLFYNCKLMKNKLLQTEIPNH